MIPVRVGERILRHLLKGESYGQEVVNRTSVPRGSIYIMLARLEEQKLVVSRVEPLQEGSIGQPRRFYTLTQLGRCYLEALDLARAHIKISAPPRAGASEKPILPEEDPSPSASPKRTRKRTRASQTRP